MVWREPKGHGKECFFCSCVVDGCNVKNKYKIQYPNLPFALQPIPHGPGVPILLPPCLQECWKQLKILSVRSLDVMW